MGERWTPDEAREGAARALGDAIAEELFTHCCDVWRARLGSVGEVSVENLEDGPTPRELDACADDAARDALVKVYERAAGALNDPDVWPLVYRTADGRRYELEVEVTVRALPDVATQLAEHDADVAEYWRRFPEAYAQATTAPQVAGGAGS